MTVFPLPIAADKVSTIDRRPVVVFGPIATDETEIGAEFDRTVNAEGSGKADTWSFSSYVSVRLNPFEASELVE